MAFTVGLNPVQPNLNPALGSPDFTSLLGGNALGRLGGASSTGLDSLFPSTNVGNAGMDPIAQSLATQQVLLQAMMMVLTKLMANGTAGSASMGGDSSGGTSAISEAGGASASGGANAANASSAISSSGATGGGAAASVEMAQKYVGSTSIGVKGKLANFTAAGGTGNNCADFVSAILANTQGFKKVPGDASVATFKQNLVKQGWKKVDKAQSKPGDVVIFNGSQHTELVTKAGGKEAIGSNGGATNQMIKTDSLSWGSQEYYTKG